MDATKIAGELLDAHDRGRTIPSVADRHATFSWDDGYEVAAEILRLRLARGEKTVGRKIGFTNRNIWPEYGATSPIWAHVYDHTLVYAENNRATVSLRGAVRPRLEPEIAFKLRTPLAPGITEPVDILPAIEWFAPSFEIVDCHFADWKFRPADSAADFSFHWKLVVGMPHPIGHDDTEQTAKQLENCRVTLRRNGAVMDEGVGANALGHPVAALAFLADIVSRQRRFAALAAGEVITTGTLTAALPIQRGEKWHSDYAGIPIAGLEIAFTN